MVLIYLFSCGSSNSQIGSHSKNNSVRCILYESDFDFNTKNFPLFESSLDKHINSDASLDVVYMYHSGGSFKDSNIKRWVYNGENTLNYSYKQGEKDAKTTTFKAKEIELGENNLKSFLQECGYSSSNDSYMISVKKNGKQLYKYFSTDRLFTSLKSDDKNKLVNLIELMNTLNGIVE
jgi:hypothetical protein